MVNSAIELVEPPDLVHAAGRLVESAFVGSYGGSPWLAIRLPRGEEGMAATLRAHGGAERPSEPPSPLEFHTRVATLGQIKMNAEKRPQTQKEPNVGDLVKFVTEPSYFTAVSKRLDPEGPLGARVS